MRNGRGGSFPAVPACISCKLSKVWCDKGQPCKRCVRLKKQCLRPIKKQRASNKRQRLALEQNTQQSYSPSPSSSTTTVAGGGATPVSINLPQFGNGSGGFAGEAAIGSSSNFGGVGASLTPRVPRPRTSMFSLFHMDATPPPPLQEMEDIKLTQRSPEDGLVSDFAALTVQNWNGSMQKLSVDDHMKTIIAHFVARQTRTQSESQVIKKKSC